MAKTSIKAAVKDAVRTDVKVRRVIQDGSATQGVSTLDSFVNFAHKMGIGADNPLSSGTYGFNPITRQRTLLEWIHRGSWLGGVAVDVVADDMTRQGIEYVSELPPDDAEQLDHCIQRYGVWESINETVKWSRLYGGAIGVILIDGQDMATPLQFSSIAAGSFRGLLSMDRWMVDPALEDLVTDFGPHLGLPKYYRVGANAPALRGKSVHYSRCVFRMEGIRLPYQQRLTENLWGISVLERLYDRMIAYDSASTGAAQLIYKAYLRTLSIDGMREVISSGGPALDGLVKYTEMMRRFQGMEGITLIDAKDKFEAQTHGAFSGIDSALDKFAEQLSGALQIPLTRLFGQSPAGFSDGDNDMRNYYDHIKQKQEANLHAGVVKVYKAAALSEGITLPPNFALGFRSLWQLTEIDKASIAKTNSETILATHEAALISDQVAMQELRQASRVTGVFTNITSELIDAADDEIADPMEGMVDPATGLPMAPPDGAPGAPINPPAAPGAKIPGVPNFKPPGGEQKPGLRAVPSTEKKDGEAGSQGTQEPVDPSKARRKAVQQPASPGGEANKGNLPRVRA